MPRALTVLEDLPFCLARAAIAFRRFGDQTLRAAGLEAQPPGMASVLHALHEVGDCTVNRLVEMTELPNGTLSGLLDMMERDDYIVRLDNPADGRSWIVRLTKRGQQLCTKLQQRHAQVMTHFREVLSETELAELTRLLEKITVSMRTAPPSIVHPAASRRQPQKTARRR